MEIYLNHLLPSLVHFHYLIYWLAFLAALLETVFLLGLFLPGSTLLLLLGAYAAGGHIDPVDLWWFALAGAVLGDNVNYYLGKRYGRQWTHNGIWIVKPEHFRAGHEFFKKHGSKSIFLGRFVPTIKEIIPFVAGTVGMNHRRFMLWNVLGAMGWALQWLGAGYIFAQSLGLAQLWMSRIGILAVTVVLVSLLLAMLQHQVIRHGRVVVEFLLSVLQSIYTAVLTNEMVQAWKKNHPRLSAFIRRRFDRTRFRGRTLTLLTLAFCYVLFLFAGIIEDLVNSDPIVALDQSIAQLVKVFRAPEVLHFFTWITALGSWQVSVPMACIAAMFFVVMKKRPLILPMAVSILGSELFTTLGKYAFHRPRPAEAAFYEPSYSFPSGHATIAVALYGFLGYLAIRHAARWQTKVKIFFFTGIVVGLLGLSRIIVGVHYLSDVWGGYLVGALWLIIGISLTEWLVAQKMLVFHTPVPPKRKAMGAALSALALCYYVIFAIVYQPGPAPAKQMATMQLTRDLSELLTAQGLQFTQTLFGRRQQPISVEIIAENDQTLAAQLQKAGWKNAAEPDLHTLLRQFTNFRPFTDKPAWLDQVGRPQQTMKTPTPARAACCQSGFTDKSNKTGIPVAPAFWDGKINNWSLILADANGPERTIFYIWTTPYRIGSAHVYVGITRTYVGKKWLFLHTIQPDVDGSRKNLLRSLQRMNIIRQYCLEKFVPAMTGEYLLHGTFFTRGQLLEINMLPVPIRSDVSPICKKNKKIHQIRY